jgi:ADP-ribose pyrophosphatase YjhB (NUDIX family)
MEEFGINSRKKYQNTSIVSYGIILYHINKNNINFLLYHRRDTFEYMDFIRGMWNTEMQIIDLFRLMSVEERKRIREYTFKELWDDLWIQHDCKIYREGYSKAKKKYDMIKYKIPYILDNTETSVLSPPWGFPKGKKNGYHEDSIKCALREFTEETKIDLNKIDLVHSNSFTENFKGSNNKNYTTHYYIAETKEYNVPKPSSIADCIRKKTLSEEASEIKWFTIDETLDLVDENKKEIIKNILPVIEEKIINTRNK